MRYIESKFFKYLINSGWFISKKLNFLKLKLLFVNVFCIKLKNFKLIYFSSTNEWNFFDLITDTKEENNIHGSGLKIEEELKEKLLEWINRK